MRLKAVAAVAIGAAVAAGVIYWRDDARRVRAVVTDAADALSAQPGEGDVGRLARVAGFANRLAPDVVVEAGADGPQLTGKEAVAALASRLATIAGIERLEVSGLEVTFDDTKTRAVVTGVAHVTATGSGAAPHDGDAVRIELVKASGAWLIARASPEPALAR